LTIYISIFFCFN